MDYTKIAPSLIYRKRKGLEEFIQGNDLNCIIVENMQEINVLMINDFEQRALTCLNAAYYICTLILLEKFPAWRLPFFYEYPRGKDTFHPAEYQVIILSLVNIFLTHSSEECQLKNQKTISKIDDFINNKSVLEGIIGHDGTHLKTKNFIFIYEILKRGINQDIIVPQNEFAPRRLDDKSIELEVIVDNMDYVKEYIQRIPDYGDRFSIIDSLLARFPDDNAIGLRIKDGKNALKELRKNTETSSGQERLLAKYDLLSVGKKKSEQAKKSPKEESATLLEAKVRELKKQNAGQAETIAKLTAHVNDAEEEIRQLKNQLELLTDEADSLRSQNEELSHIAKQASQLGEWYSGDDYEPLPENEELTMRERLVFFATVMSLDLDKKFTVISNLARFVSTLCNDQKNIIQFISRMKRPGEESANAKAAIRVATLMKLIIPKEYRNDTKLKINSIIESIKLNFPQKEEE